MSTSSNDKSDDDLVINFALPNKAHRMVRDKAKVVDAGGIDLSSGYPKNKIWTTQDGRRIPIPELQDSHLLNIIAFLRRRSEEYRKIVIGELAMGVAEISLISMLFDVSSSDERQFEKIANENHAVAKKVYKMSPEEILRTYIPQYPHLLEEAYRRKILIEA